MKIEPAPLIWPISDHINRKTLNYNSVNKVVASNGFSENRGLGGVLSLEGS